MADKTPVTEPAFCEQCRGFGPASRIDWHRFDRGDACPDCGARSEPAPGSREGRIAATLEQLRAVLLRLDDDELEGQLGLLDERSRLLSGRSPLNR